MTRKIYIAGPVTGIPERNSRVFGSVSDALTSAGYKVVNPLRLVPPDMDSAKAMRRLVPELCACDGGCLRDGWEASEGACVEVTVARACGMSVGDLDYWIVSLGGGK